MNIACKSDAVIPKFIDIFSKEPFGTMEVSIIRRAEFESGTEEVAVEPPVRGSLDKVKNFTLDAFASVTGLPIFSVGCWFS